MQRRPRPPALLRSSGAGKVRLRRDRENRMRDLAKKLDQNGWRMFVSGSAYTIATGKGSQRRNAEVMLVETVRRWWDQVVDLLPERAADLRRIVEAGLDRPEPPPRKDRRGDGFGMPFLAKVQASSWTSEMAWRFFFVPMLVTSVSALERRRSRVQLLPGVFWRRVPQGTWLPRWWMMTAA